MEALAGALLLWLLEAFLTPDQQGRLWLERGEAVRAAHAFEDRLWSGLAWYEAGDWAASASALAPVDTARSRFQYGNALARQERLPEAVAAYTRALELQPDFPEAAFNLDWVQGLLELDQKEYEDAGGTGGKLEADKIVFDEKGAKGKGEMTTQEARFAPTSDGPSTDVKVGGHFLSGEHAGSPESFVTTLQPISPAYSGDDTHMESATLN